MNGDKINGRTLEEIKARIDYCRNVKTAGDCMSCPYGEDADVCASDFMFDSFDYMQHLETELAEARKDVDMLGEQVVALDGAYNAMKRERDAAVEQLRKGGRACSTCKFSEDIPENDKICEECRLTGTKLLYSNWEWVGPQEVE